MAFQGIDVRQTGDRIVFRASLKDSAGAVVSSGTTNLRLYELQNDGTLHSYDWNDNTFKATALTTENQAMTHRQGNNSTTDTGIWTHALTTLTGFTAGNIYFAQVTNSGASPTEQEREFQFGVSSAFDPYDATDGGLTNLDAAVSSRSSHSATDVWSATTRTLTAFGFNVTVATNNDKSGYALTVAGNQAIRDAILDRVLNGNHDTSGTLGRLVQLLVERSISGSSVGEWTFSTNTTASDPGAAGIKVNNANMALATELYVRRDALEGTDFLPIIQSLGPGDLILLVNKADALQRNCYRLVGDPTTNGAAGSEWFDMTIEPIITDMDIVDTATVQFCIMHRKEGLVAPTSASAYSVAGTFSKAITDILSDTGTDGVAISTATMQALADEILSRDVDNVEATAAEHTLATIILAILESARSGTTWEIKRSDGVTTHATKTLTVDAAADPVTGVS